MPTLEQLQADRETLRQVLASGALEVQYSDGARVRFRDRDEIVATMAEMDSAITGTSGATPPSRIQRAGYHRGIGW